MRKKTLFTATAVALLALPQLAPDLSVLSAGSWVFGPATAFAEEEDPEITAEAKKHYKLGQDAFAAGQYDLAIKELKRAYVLKRIPAILVNIAMTYRKTKDYEMAQYFYRKFLSEAPADDKQRPQIEAAIGEVDKEKAAAAAPAMAPAKPAVEMAKPAVEPAKPAAPAAKPAEPAAAPATAAAEPGKTDAAAPAAKADAAPAAPAESADKPASEWAHTPIDAVPPGQPIDVRVQMPVMKGVKVKVFYRKEGQANFDSVELKRRGNEKVARIPGSVAEGKAFQYYVEARDGAGTLVKSSGNEFNPNIVLIDPTARPQLIGAEVQGEGPDDEELAKRVKTGPKRDIENEAVSFNISEQEKAMRKLRDSLRSSDTKKEGKSVFSPLGWAGLGTMIAGVAALGGGAAGLGLAANRADLVSSDSACNTKIRVGGVPQCPHYGGNEDPNLSRALKPPTADYESEGRTFNTVGTALTAVGGVLVAGGAGMLIADVVKKRQAMKPPAPKTRKVKKVIEVEEQVSQLQVAPVVGPGTLGVVSELRF
ncbi:MAG: tetratricopeptide repeat protein [Polyangia bacterium]